MCIRIVYVWLCFDVYLNECSQQHTAHLLLEDHLVLGVVVAGRDEGGEQHSDEMRVAEVLERQLTQFLQHAGLAARLHYHLEHTNREQGQSVSHSLLVVNHCHVTLLHVNLPLKTTHKQPLRGDLWGTVSHHTIMDYKTQWWDILFFLCTNSNSIAAVSKRCEVILGG